MTHSGTYPTSEKGYTKMTSRLFATTSAYILHVSCHILPVVLAVLHPTESILGISEMADQVGKKHQVARSAIVPPQICSKRFFCRRDAPLARLGHLATLSWVRSAETRLGENFSNNLQFRHSVFPLL